ncbi:AI-2E family transporter [Sphingomonas japonica]
MLAILGAAWLLIEMTSLLMLVFAAIVLAVVFDAMARLLTRWTKLPRGLALTLAIFILLGVFIGIFVMFGAQLAREFDTIREKIPGALTAIEGQLETWGLGDRVRSVFEQGAGDVSSLMSSAGSYALSIGSGLADFALVLVGAIFLAADPAVYRRGVILLTPKRAEPVMDDALDDCTHALRGWMNGQLMSMIVVAAATSAGLWLLGVPAAGGLGLIAGLLDVIPFVGPIIAGTPAVILAFTVSPATALWTVGLFFLVQQIQGNFLQPMIQKYAVDVPPAVLLFAVGGAGILFGFLGVLLAAPLTVVTFVLVQRIYVKTLLGREITVAGREERETSGG